MKSDTYDLSAKIYQVTVLIDNAHLQALYALHGDRKVNDLRRNFDDLISWRYCWKKFVYRVNRLTVYVGARGYVALHSQSVNLEYLHWLI